MSLSFAFFLWFLEALSAETFPYVSFRGQTLANHSYVNLSLVGDDGSGSDSVQCHTDLGTCCSGAQGSHRGDWYFPNGDRLGFKEDSDIHEARKNMTVYLYRRSDTSPSGIYHCKAPTIAVHDDYDTSVRDIVYVGLYYNGGRGIIIMLKIYTLYFTFFNLQETSQ